MGNAMDMVKQQKTACGRLAYPSLVNGKPCGEFTIEDLRKGTTCDNEDHTHPVCALWPKTELSFWRDLLARYRNTTTPPEAMMAPSWGGEVTSRQLFMSSKGGGATMHFHRGAYNVLMFGKKKWALLPPRYAVMTGAGSADWLQRPHSFLPAGLPLRC